jgi:hypothetical protein
MVTNSQKADDLIGLAKEAFPWFDANRLRYFVSAVQEAAFQASRIEAAGQPSVLPNVDRERRLAEALVEFLSNQIHNPHAIGRAAPSLPVAPPAAHRLRTSAQPPV